jgi:alcohol dehydrogenase class IV
MIEPFHIIRCPEIYFGNGEVYNLPGYIAPDTKTVLLITGGSSLKKSGHLDRFTEALEKSGRTVFHDDVAGEPSPAMVDDIVKRQRPNNIDIVIAVGGGSPMDAAKAVAAMLPSGEPLKPYLDAIGDRDYDGNTTPFVAVPTTAGTGTEATKNAVISEVGENGFKRSLNHKNTVPHIAVIDPELMRSCPSSVTAACAMDAITQLLESYVSNTATPLTDALAISGLEYALPAVCDAVHHGDTNMDARAAMAYGALISGITLTNAGLGVVHGFASSIGGYFDIPHGVVCGSILPAATEINIRKLQAGSDPVFAERLAKHARVGRMLPGGEGLSEDDALNLLIGTLYGWVEEFEIPTFSHFGVSVADVERIVSVTREKNNTVPLEQSDIRDILLKRL